MFFKLLHKLRIGVLAQDIALKVCQEVNGKIVFQALWISCICFTLRKLTRTKNLDSQASNERFEGIVTLLLNEGLIVFLLVTAFVTNATTSAEVLPSPDHLDCIFHIRFIRVIPQLYCPLSFPDAEVLARASLVKGGPFHPGPSLSRSQTTPSPSDWYPPHAASSVFVGVASIFQRWRGNKWAARQIEVRNSG